MVNSSTALVKDVGSLAAIFEKNINIAVLERTAASSVSAYALGLTGLAGDRFFAPVGVDTAAAALARQLPPGAGREAFVEDVATWVEVLADLTGAGQVGVRIATIEVPMCPRFHVDRVLLRLITTYRGAATEWVDDRDVDRRWLGEGARGLPDEETGLLLRDEAVRTCQAFDVAILKGEIWPGNEGRGVVHRSPGVAGPRVVMTLDPLA